MSLLARFFRNLRYKLFCVRIDWEIFHRIFPHSRNDADYAYPFSAEEELEARQFEGMSETARLLREINDAGNQMPKAQGLAFRYIVGRDLQIRLRRYLAYTRANKYRYTTDGVARRLEPEMNN